MALSDETNNQIAADVQNRYERGTPYSSRDIAGMSNDEYETVLHHSAMLQRARPEDAMLRIQKKIKTGMYSHAVEHVGDIYHRAQEHGGAFGYSYVQPKIESNLSDLKHPYGFEREARENVLANSKYYKDPSINWEAAVVLGRDYAQEHSRLPVYNLPAHWASQAAQHLGNMRFGATTGALEQFTPHMHPHKDTEGWKQLLSRDASIDFLKSQGR